MKLTNNNNNNNNNNNKKNKNNNNNSSSNSTSFIPSSSSSTSSSSSSISHKRPRRRSKDRIRDIHLTSTTSFNSNNSQNLNRQNSSGKIQEIELDLQAWGLGDIKRDIQQFNTLVNKCIGITNEKKRNKSNNNINNNNNNNINQEINNNINNNDNINNKDIHHIIIDNTNKINPNNNTSNNNIIYSSSNHLLRLSSAIPFLGEQVSKWHTGRMKSQIITSWNVAISKILQAETIFHIWLEAIQVKKRVIKAEALNYVDELENLISFHENRLDAIDDLIDECKELAVFLKKRCNHLSAMKIFMEEYNIQNRDISDCSNEQHDEDVIFTGYSNVAGKSIHTNDILQYQNENNLLNNQHISKSPLENEINMKLNLSIELINRLNKSQNIIRQNQKKEMILLTIIWRYRILLKELSEFSCDFKKVKKNFLHLKNENLQNSEFDPHTNNCSSRNDYIYEEEDVITKQSQKLCLKSSHETIEYLEILTEQEGKAKAYLHKLSDYRTELFQYKSNLEKYFPSADFKLDFIGNTSFGTEIILGNHIINEFIQESYNQKNIKKFNINIPSPTSTSWIEFNEEQILNLQNNFINDSIYIKELTFFELQDFQFVSSFNLDPLLSNLTIINKQSKQQQQQQLQLLPSRQLLLSPSYSYDKMRSQSVDFDILDGSPRSLHQLSGCGFIWQNEQISNFNEELKVDIQDIRAIYSASFQYCHIFTTIAVKDYLDEFFHLDIPICIMSISKSSNYVFTELSSHHLLQIIREFLNDENAHIPSSRFDTLPNNFHINLNNIPGLDMLEKMKLFALLRCSNFNFEEIFSIQSISNDSSQYFFEGITQAIYSCNYESAKTLIQSTSNYLLTNPQLSSLGDPFLTSWKQTQIILAPLENLVSEVIQSELSTNIQSNLLVPLGAIRILLAAVNKQTYHRFCECCEQLSQWLHLSSILTHQLIKSTKLSRSSSTSSLTALHDDSVHNISTIDHLQKIHIKTLKIDIEDTIPRKVPLARSIAISTRSELYHDLLNTYAFIFTKIKTKPIQDLSEIRYSLQFFEQNFENTISLIYILCSLLESLDIDYNQWMNDNISTDRLNYSKQQWSILFSVRNEIRLNILQYILGLDDRWNLQSTLSTCRFVVSCLDQCTNSKVKQLSIDQTSFNILQFYQRKSRFGYSSTLNLLSLFLPINLTNKKCHVIYSMLEDGSGIETLQKIISNYNFTSFILLVQDSFGYLFGAYISLTNEKNKLISNQHSFLFRALPDIKIFPLNKSNEDINFSPWISSKGIHLGIHPSWFFFIDPKFSSGFTTPIETFGNERLSLDEDFKCCQIELWIFRST